MDGNQTPRGHNKSAKPDFGRFTHAAIMGDIVASEKVASVKELYHDFNYVVARANQDLAKYLVSPLTITLGDEFQGIAASFAGGVKIMRRLRGAMLEAGVPCRFVVGLVRIETPINNENAWNMMGPGLADARARLAEKRDPNAYRFELPNDKAAQALMDAIGSTLSWIEAGWTDRQREVMLNWFRVESPENLAAQLRHSLPTLYKVRRAANFDLYDRQWRALEIAAAAIDERNGLE